MRFSTFTIFSVLAGGMAVHGLTNDVRAESDGALEQMYRRAVVDLLVEELAERMPQRKRSDSTRDTKPPAYQLPRRHTAPAVMGSDPSPGYSSRRSSTGSNAGMHVADGFRPRDLVTGLFERQRKRSDSTRDTKPPAYQLPRRHTAPAVMGSDPAPGYSSRRSSTGSSAAGHVADGFRPREAGEELVERQRKRSDSTRDTKPPAYQLPRRHTAPAVMGSDPAPGYSSRRSSTGSNAGMHVADGFRPREVKEELVERQRKRSDSTRDTKPPAYQLPRRHTAPAVMGSDPAPGYSSRRSSTGSSAAGHVADGFRRY